MRARDAVAVACVLWPSLRVPVALVDLAVEVLEQVRVDDAGQVEIGRDVRVGVGLDWSTWGLGLRVHHEADDPDEARDHVAHVVAFVGPLEAWVEYLGPSRGDDDLQAPSWWAGAA